MNNIENGPRHEDIDPDGLSADQRAQAEAMLPEQKDGNLPENERRDCEPEIGELLSLIEAFKNKHSLEELNKVIDLTPEQAPHHPIRQPAKEDLPPMVTLLRVLKQETNITEERYKEVFAIYKVVSDAVGIMSNNKLRHS